MHHCMNANCPTRRRLLVPLTEVPCHFASAAADLFRCKSPQSLGWSLPAQHLQVPCAGLWLCCLQDAGKPCGLANLRVQKQHPHPHLPPPEQLTCPRGCLPSQVAARPRHSPAEVRACQLHRSHCCSVTATPAAHLPHTPATCRGGPARELLKHNPHARQSKSSCAALVQPAQRVGPHGDGRAAPNQCSKQRKHHSVAHLPGRPAPCRVRGACLSCHRAAHVRSRRRPPLGHRLRPSTAQEGLPQVVMHRQGSMVVGPWRPPVQVRAVPCRTDADSTRARGGLGKVAQCGPKVRSR